MAPFLARLVASALAFTLAGTFAGAPTAAEAAPRTATDVRSYTAAVNLLDPSEGAFQGGIAFTSVVGGPTTVSVFLSSAATVSCDGYDDIASTTISTLGSEANEPGPVTLDIDRRLRSATGQAVVDLLVETSPGCGAEPTSEVHPAQSVAIAVTGTSVRFRTGIGSRATSGADGTSFSSVDLSRDGVGTASVGPWVVDAASEASFLRYAVDRTSSRGDVVDLPPNAAPAGGLGALAAWTRETPTDAGTSFEDVFVTAMIGLPPARDARVDAFALRAETVVCGDGTLAESFAVVEASGPAEVTIDRRLSGAQADAVLDGVRFSVDGCTGEASEEMVSVPVSLSLQATGEAVRSVDTRFQITPGAGSERERLSYTARWATGLVTVGDLTGAPDLAAISRAGR